MSDSKWSEVRDNEAVERTIAALGKNGMTALHVKTAADAKAKALEIIPEGAEVFQASSETVDIIGLGAEINESGRYNATRAKFYDPTFDAREKARLGAAPEWVVGSVHAVTEDGSVLIASKTGSQLASEVFGADHVLWVVGTQKIVKDVDEAMKRIYEYTLPLESTRARKAYNIPADQEGSFVSKLLVISREVRPDRITIIFVDEVLGY